MELQSAAFHGDAQQVARLLAAGVLVDELDSSGRSALWLAARAGNTAAVQLLLAAGAAPDIADIQGQLPIHMAALGGHSAVVQMLLRAAPQTAAHPAGTEAMYPLHFAAMRCDSQTVEQLIAAAPNVVTTRATDGILPLHLACTAGNTSAAGALLAAAPSTAMASCRRDGLPFYALFHRVASKFKFWLDNSPHSPRVERLKSILRLLLPHVPPNVSLPALATMYSDTVRPFYAELVTCWPLTADQWQQVPSPCPRLARALPTVLARSEAEAAALVAHLPAPDRCRLRTAALALHRQQRCLGVSLPADLTRRILAQFDA